MDFSVFTATGRGGVATTFATDYQALGINPANLGIVKSFRDPFITIGFGEASLTFSAEAIPRKQMLDAIGEGIGGKQVSQVQNLTYADKIRASQQMAGTDMIINSTVMPIGIGVHLPKNHGIAFSTRTSFHFFANLNDQLADLAFMGMNSSYFERLLLTDGSIIPNPRNPKFAGSIPELTEEEYRQVVRGALEVRGTGSSFAELVAGSRITASLTNEYNLGYGTRIYDSYNLALYAGLDLSYVQGIMLLNIDVDEQQQVEHNTFSLPDEFVVKTDSTLVFNNDAKAQDAIFPKGISAGLGYTLGLSAVVKKNLRLGFSVSNWRGLFRNSKFMNRVGAVGLSDNAYAISESSQLEEFKGYGFDSYNLFTADNSSFNLAGQDLSGPFQWERVSLPPQELPANIRMGMSYDYLNTLHVGVDLIIPLNQAFGNPSGTFVALGGDFRLSRLLRISSGVNTLLRENANEQGGATHKMNVPLGITYTARKGTYEAGISTRDILTYISGKNGSTISFAAGFLRFKIGAVPIAKISKDE